MEGEQGRRAREGGREGGERAGGREGANQIVTLTRGFRALIDTV